jgi:hypothetical protein
MKCKLKNDKKCKPISGRGTPSLSIDGEGWGEDVRLCCRFLPIPQGWGEDIFSLNLISFPLLWQGKTTNGAK